MAQTSPQISGISPKEGIPGTMITLRGENLGISQEDIIMLIICGTPAISYKWKSPSKILARIGNAKRGVGDILIATKSGGRGKSDVQFRVFIEQVGPLQPSCIWVDETRTVPGREIIRNIAESSESTDALGLTIDPGKKLEHSVLSRIFPSGSGNRRMENFNPSYYLLENHKYTNLEDLKRGFKNLQLEITRDEKTTKELHKNSLYSLINCVDALNTLGTRIQTERNTRGWPLTKGLSEKMIESQQTADRLFKEVLERKDRADAARNALSVLTRFRFIFFLAENIDENMAKGEYSTILNDFHRLNSLFKDTEIPLFKETMNVLNEKILVFKQAIKQKLIDVPTSFEEQSKLIKYLKILDPESDPAWDCITAYHCWLEDCLYRIQMKHYEQATASDGEKMDKLFTFDNATNYNQQFVSELLCVLTEKIQAFWKLAQSYSNTNDDNYLQKQDDINQMLTNTINLSSWFMLNALVPASLPEAVAKQYKDQFVDWPSISIEKQLPQLFASLQALRSAIKSLMDFQFTRVHLKPLFELCTTLRLKCLGIVVDRTNQAIVNLGSRETWKIDAGSTPSKTNLVDFYETEITEILPYVKEILSFNSYPGESDLFLNERIRQMIIDLFVVVLVSFKQCYDQLFQFKGDHRRPNRLLLQSTNFTDDSSSISSVNEDKNSSKLDQGQGNQFSGLSEATGRKLLMSICNVEYVSKFSLILLSKRLSDNGVKHCDTIIEKCRQKFDNFRQTLLKHYLTMKTSTLVSLIESINYTYLPEEEDVSYFIKELITCVVFIQAELCLFAPQLLHQVLTSSVEASLDRLVKMLTDIKLSTRDHATQVVIDLTALEEAFQAFLSIDTRRILNSIRARLMDKLDKEKFQNCIQTFRQSLHLAIESLQNGIDDNNLNTSNV